MLKVFRISGVIILILTLVTSITACQTKYSLDVIVGNGQGQVTPASGEYADGTLVSIAAIPDSGWEFERWEGGVIGNQNPLAQVRMDSDKIVLAYFIEEQSSTPTPTPTTISTLTPTPTQTSMPTPTSTCSGSVPSAQSPLTGATSIGSIVDCDLGVNVPLAWSAACNGILYEWQLSEDSAFTYPATGTTVDLTVTVLNQKPSTNYFWRVRVAEPSLGPWSTTQSFTTIIGEDVSSPQLLNPQQGATITDTTPLFTWTAIECVTSYEIQVATDPGFSMAHIVIDSDLGNVQAYQAAISLAEGTYYWRVQGSGDDFSSPWSALGSFTLDI